mgnify:CR=1 FL=1
MNNSTRIILKAPVAPSGMIGGKSPNWTAHRWRCWCGGPPATPSTTATGGWAGAPPNGWNGSSWWCKTAASGSWSARSRSPTSSPMWPSGAMPCWPCWPTPLRGRRHNRQRRQARHRCRKPPPKYAHSPGGAASGRWGCRCRSRRSGETYSGAGLQLQRGRPWRGFRRENGPDAPAPLKTSPSSAQDPFKTKDPGERGHRGRLPHPHRGQRPNHCPRRIVAF